MKRRKFIGVSLLTAASPVAASAAGSRRLYGAPASVQPEAVLDPKLILPLVDAGVPAPALGYLSQISALWRRVLSDDVEMQDFALDPQGYLRRLGLRDVDGILQDDNVRLLLAVGSPGIRGALRDGDYRRAFSLLTASGVLQDLDPEPLARRLSGAFEERREELLAALKNLPEDLSSEDVLKKLVSERSPASSNDSLIAATEIVRKLYADSAATPSAVVPVVAIAIAAVLISVGISFTVATGAAIVTAALAMTEVTVGSFLPQAQGGMHLDPIAKSNFQRVIKLSSLTGDKGMLIASARELIEFEVGAIVDALVVTGLLDRDSRRAAVLKDVVVRYAFNVSGLPAELPAAAVSGQK